MRWGDPVLGPTAGIEAFLVDAPTIKTFHENPSTRCSNYGPRLQPNKGNGKWELYHEPNSTEVNLLDFILGMSMRVFFLRCFLQY